MGRPLHKKYFGNTNPSGLAGEGVASVTIGGTNNNYTAVPTLTIAAPSTPGGVTATATATVTILSVSLNAAGTGYTGGDVITLVGGTGTAATITVDTVDTGGEILTFTLTTGGAYTAGLPTTGAAVTGGTGNDDATFDVTSAAISLVTVTNAGSGYTTTVPTVTPSAGNATLTAVLSNVAANSFLSTAWVAGALSASAADIEKQVSGRRYKVTTGDGTSVCKLVAGAPAEGEMNLTATDSAGGTYYVTKVTARRATLVQNTGTQFANGDSVKWTLAGPAVLNESVIIDNA